MPRGTDRVEPGDRLIVFTTHAAADRVRDYFTEREDAKPMRLAIVVHVTGTLVRLFGPALLAPALVAACYGEWRDAAGFVVALRRHRRRSAS